MRTELPGIFNWGLEGARILAGEKLFQAKAADITAQEVAEILDPIQGFISDVVIFPEANGSQHFVKSKQLFAVYKEWHQNGHKHPAPFRRFIQDFRSRAGDRVHPDHALIPTRQKGYCGLAIDREWLQEQDLAVSVDARPPPSANWRFRTTTTPFPSRARPETTIVSTAATCAGRRFTPGSRVFLPVSSAPGAP